MRRTLLLSTTGKGNPANVHIAALSGRPSGSPNVPQNLPGSLPEHSRAV